MRKIHIFVLLAFLLLPGCSAAPSVPVVITPSEQQDSPVATEPSVSQVSPPATQSATPTTVAPSEPQVDPLITQYQKNVKSWSVKWGDHLILGVKSLRTPSALSPVIEMLREDRLEFLALPAPDSLRLCREDMSYGMSKYISSFIYSVAGDFSNASIEANAGGALFQSGYLGILYYQVSSSQIMPSELQIDSRVFEPTPKPTPTPAPTPTPKPQVDPIISQITKYQKDIGNWAKKWNEHQSYIIDAQQSEDTLNSVIKMLQEDQNGFLALVSPELFKAYRDEMNIGMNKIIQGCKYCIVKDFSSGDIEMRIGSEHLVAGYCGIVYYQVIDPQVISLATQVIQFQNDVKDWSVKWFEHGKLAMETPRALNPVIELLKEDRRQFIALAVPEPLRIYRDHMRLGLSKQIQSYMYFMAGDYSNADIAMDIGLEYQVAGFGWILDYKVSP